MERAYTTINKHQTLIKEMEQKKLDIAYFDEKHEVFENSLETIRFAVFDNFLVGKATDNYIEKYLPF